MIESKCEWVKQIKVRSLERTRHIKHSTVNTVRSTRMKTQKSLGESVRDYSLYKVESMLECEIN